MVQDEIQGLPAVEETEVELHVTFHDRTAWRVPSMERTPINCDID